MDNGKAAFVTGAAEGIGAAIVHALAKDGYRVYYCDIDNDKGIVRQSLHFMDGLDTVFLHADVSSPNDIRRVKRRLVSDSITLDLIVNNAGISDPTMGFPTEALEKWNHPLETNLFGSFYTVNFLSSLVRDGGTIINIASTRAFQSERNTLSYSASKGGIVALTHSMAITLAPRKIRVNSISPGWIDTSEFKLPSREADLNELDNKQHPSGRVGKPQDVSELVLFLASDKASWINAENIVIDGGMSKRMIYFDREVLEEAIESLTGDRELSRRLIKEAFDRKK